MYPQLVKIWECIHAMAHESWNLLHLYLQNQLKIPSAGVCRSNSNVSLGLGIGWNMHYL